MSSELIETVDRMARDKNIDRDLVLNDLEEAMKSAVRKKYGADEDVTVVIDRISGDISAHIMYDEGEKREKRVISMGELGRIAAQTAKQVMIQRIREAERGSIFEEFVERKGTIQTGTVSRFEGGALVVNIGRTEGFLPRSEQIPGENHQPGERIRCLILDVREDPRQVKIVLSRSHPDFIRRLFELEVPEVAERIIEIKALAREAGYRTKVAVSSIDMKVDAVGACVGVRGSRIKNIVEELSGEKIDIVRWNESSQILISNALRPAEVQDISLCFELGRSTVVVPEEQLSLAIGKRGQNVRLGARLTGWDIDILTPKEYNKGLDRLAATLRKIEGVDEVLAERVSLLGMINVMDVEAVGVAPLVDELEMSEALATLVVETCAAEAKLVQAENEAEKTAAAEAAAQAVIDAAAETEGATDGAPDAAETPDPEVGGDSPATDADATPGESADGDLSSSGAVDATQSAEPGITEAEPAAGAVSSPTPDDLVSTGEADGNAPMEIHPPASPETERPGDAATSDSTD